MTKASQGLANALGRSASGEVIALAEMSVDDIIASLSDETKTALAAKLSPEANAATPAAAGDMPPKKKDGASEDGDEDDMDGEGDPPAKKSKAQAAISNASAHERIKAVAAAVATDENCKGKAAMALDLLADDEFVGLSASGIVKMVAKGSAADAGDPDAAARAHMRERLAAQQPETTADNGDAPKPAANHGWDDIHAELRERRR